MEAEPKRENNKKIFCNHPKKGNQPRPDGSRADAYKWCEVIR